MRRRLGWSFVGATAALASAAALAAVPGNLDRAFGTGGKLTVDFGDSDGAAAVALQPDRKIVIAGSTANPQDVAVARVTTAGTLDSGFGAGGRVRTSFSGSIDRAFAVLAQGDGKIVTVGDALPDGEGPLDFALARYNGDGSLDGSFGAGGAVRTTFDADGIDTAQAAVLQPDGRIVAAGRTRKTGRAGSLALARYLPNGQLDPSFGGGGLVVTPIAGMFPRALALQPDGKLIAGGWNGETSVLVRYNPDGSLDPSFDGDGILIGGLDLTMVRDIAVDGAGRILAAEVNVVRLDSAGRRDAAFGAAGTARPGPVAAVALALQPDGKILVAGMYAAPGHGDFGVARLTSAGRLDEAFGQGGVTTADIGSGSHDEVADAVLQPDGKLVVAGSSRAAAGGPWDFAIARFEAVVPCIVPNVTRKTVVRARVAITRARCRLGQVRRRYSAKVRKGLVISQAPRAGARLAEFSKVSVVVSRGKKR